MPTNSEDHAVELKRMSRRGFAWTGAAALAGFAGWKWVRSRSTEGLVPWPLRRVLELNERVAQTLFDPNRLAPTFRSVLAAMPRVNGRIGIDEGIDLAAWRLNVSGPAGSKTYTLAEIQALPRVEMVTELKCVEGWSTVVQWAGVRLADLAEHSGLASPNGQRLPYVELKTPDRRYYVGLDAPSAYHPQTLLCTEMAGQPLTISHGAPVRLTTPLKYGIKSLKQVGSIRFTSDRPADYWADRGYDWYAGH
jgi:DMSO/TMAO reductase YedYZ molybdopterin-dependent catalytic subunit